MFVRKIIFIIFEILIVFHACFGESINPLLNNLPRNTKRCNPIPNTLKACSTFYNYTTFPNSFGHTNIETAEQEYESFIRLIPDFCSKNLKFFLCSMYAPVCDANSNIQAESCRGLCEEVRDKCLPVMKKYNFDWPLSLECSKLPVSFEESGKMCVSGNEMHPNKQRISKRPMHKSKFIFDNFDPMITEKLCKHLKGLPKSTVIFVNRTNNCGLLCKSNGERSGLYSYEQRRQVLKWSPIFHGTIIFGCVLLLLTCLSGSAIDFKSACSSLSQQARKSDSMSSIHSNERRKTSEWWDWMGVGDFHVQKSIILCVGWIATCQIFYSIAYIIRYLMGHERSACNLQRKILLQEGLDNPVCAVTFMLRYFFGLASLSWWLIYTVIVCIQSFNVSTSLNKSLSRSHRILHCIGKICVPNQDAYSSTRTSSNGLMWRHVFAWAPAGFLTACLLVLRSVEGDELLGVCQVGLLRERSISSGPDSSSTEGAYVFGRRELLLLCLALGPLLISCVIVSGLLLITTANVVSNRRYFLQNRQFRRRSFTSAFTDANNVMKSQMKLPSCDFSGTGSRTLMGTGSSKASELERESRQLTFMPVAFAWLCLLPAVVQFICGVYAHCRWPRWVKEELFSVGSNEEAYIVAILRLLAEVGPGVVCCLWLLRPRTTAFWVGIVRHVITRQRDRQSNPSMFKHIHLNQFMPSAQLTPVTNRMPVVSHANDNLLFLSNSNTSTTQSNSKMNEYHQLSLAEQSASREPKCDLQLPDLSVLRQQPSGQSSINDTTDATYQPRSQHSDYSVIHPGQSSKEADNELLKFTHSLSTQQANGNQFMNHII